jgi:ABC-type antimicrobial peptide transport system permease subunit
LLTLADAAFSALAVLLACIGLFGLIGHDVARRTGGIGIRMALGAQRQSVVVTVMRESVRLVAIASC